MCDQDTENDSKGYVSPEFLNLQAKLSRRKFNALSINRLETR